MIFVIILGGWTLCGVATYFLLAALLAWLSYRPL